MAVARVRNSGKILLAAGVVQTIKIPHNSSNVILKTDGVAIVVTLDGTNPVTSGDNGYEHGGVPPLELRFPADREHSGEVRVISGGTPNVWFLFA